MNYRRVGSALLDRLFEQGLISPGPLGAGFLCASTGAMIDARGDVSECMFNLGPGRLGTLLESIAVPEIRQQAVQLAELLSERVREANPLDGLATSDVIRRQVGSRMEAVLA